MTPAMAANVESRLWSLEELVDGHWRKMDILSAIADGATILTAAVATAAAIFFWCQKRKRVQRLERYLESTKADRGKGRLGPARTIPHLMVNCFMTEAQIFEAALTSEKIRPWVATEDGEETETILFSLDEKARRARRARTN
jgi:hypothetical protein